MKRRVQLAPDEVILRKALFVPCKTREGLGRWVKTYLGIDFPDCIVDPDSNCTPLDLLWTLYSAARNGSDEYSSTMAYASRSAYKTLAAAVMECLCVLHLGRSVAHMASIESQARKAGEYVRSMFARPFLREFVTLRNERRLELAWYIKTGASVTEALTKNEFEALPPEQRNAYFEHKEYIAIVVCSLQGANSEHTTYMCVDGDSEIQIRSRGESSSRRERFARTARGLFNRVAGLNAGGRPSPHPEPMLVKDPKETIEVLSLNTATSEFEFKPVTRASRSVSDTVRIVLDSGNGLICTKDHPIYLIDRGFIEAGETGVGDSVVFMRRAKTVSTPVRVRGSEVWDTEVEPVNYNDDPFEQALIGSLLGDGGVYKKPTNNAYFQERHCLAQSDYCQWKEQFFRLKLRTRPLVGGTSGYTGEPQIGFNSGNTPLLNEWADFKTTLHGVERLGPMGLAIWYQDDGCAGNHLRFSTECFTEEQNYRLANLLKIKFDIDVDVRSYHKGDRQYFFLNGPVASKVKLNRICAPYVHPSMAYKFDLSQNTGKCLSCGNEYFFVDSHGVTCGKAICRAIQIGRLHVGRIVSIEPAGKRAVYDFTVEGNHNFFANGLLNKNCIDEVDVIANKDAFAEAKFIPSAKGGILPITLMTSTRKFSWGLVQTEINNAPESGLKVLHWNAVDVTAPCPTSRHEPEKPKRAIYWSRDSLKAVSEEEYISLNQEEQLTFTREMGYHGCLSNCKVYSLCRGRLATDQKSKSSLLRPVEDLQNLFLKSSLSKVKAQMMCWEPTEEGRVYPEFSRDVHMLTAAEIAQRITGEEHNPDLTKADLLALAKSLKLPFYAGMDFGYAHPFAVVMGFVALNRLYLVEAICASGLGHADRLAVCKDRIKPFNPQVYGDTASPDAVEVFKKDGYHMKTWKKTPASINDGIETVRYKLATGASEPELYLLKGDDGMDLLASKMEAYHWKTDAGGKSLAIPEEDDDDLVDAQRYLVMNVFAPRKRQRLNDFGGDSGSSSSAPEQSWIQTEIDKHMEGNYASPDGIVIKKGSFIADL